MTTIIFFALSLFVSCAGSQSINKRVVHVMNGYLFPKEVSFSYNKDALYQVNNERYIITAKATYDTKGEIEEIVVYKPEGLINYSKADILNDKKLVEYLGFSITQNLVVKSNVLFDGTSTQNVEILEENTMLLKKEEGNLIFYLLE